LKKKKTKVVYNACFGGFSLSGAAYEWLMARDPSLNLEQVPKYEDFVRWDDRPRHHPLLVECVETLKKKANGAFAELRIAKVDGKYRIDSYDGCEDVQVPEDIEWVEP
jgi:hypothetical protein